MSLNHENMQRHTHNTMQTLPEISQTQSATFMKIQGKLTVYTT